MGFLFVNWFFTEKNHRLSSTINILLSVLQKLYNCISSGFIIIAIIKLQTQWSVRECVIKHFFHFYFIATENSILEPLDHLSLTILSAQYKFVEVWSTKPLKLSMKKISKNWVSKMWGFPQKKTRLTFFKTHLNKIPSSVYIFAN